MALLVHGTSGTNAAASDEQVDGLSLPTCAGGFDLVLQELKGLQDCWIVSWQELRQAATGQVGLFATSVTTILCSRDLH